MKRITIVATMLSLFIAPAVAQDKASQKFLTGAIARNFAEAQMGELAQKNGQSSEVKSYGQMLATDHNAANQKAIEAAKSLGVNVPNGPSSKQKADYEKMAKMNGATFDEMFAQHMVVDHKKDIASYQKASKKKDAAGQYAQSSIPTLQKHLEEAQKIQKQKPSSR